MEWHITFSPPWAGAVNPPLGINVSELVKIEAMKRKIFFLHLLARVCKVKQAVGRSGDMGIVWRWGNKESRTIQRFSSWLLLLRPIDRERERERERAWMARALSAPLNKMKIFGNNFRRKKGLHLHSYAELVRAKQGVKYGFCVCVCVWNGRNGAFFFGSFVITHERKKKSYIIPRIPLFLSLCLRCYM